MSQQSDKAPASVTRLTPETGKEEKKEEKEYESLEEAFMGDS
tara:strand:- start:779 stop:904 length:126 start_codon:yes stop_codon:yes gene_type:complete